MTADDFRTLALSFPEAVEGAHMGHPDFRVGGKIFATLQPDGQRGMVKLSPDQQAALMGADPEAFEPAAGAWGRQGSTLVNLKLAKKASVRKAVAAAWANTAPRRLLEAGGERA